MNTIYKWTIIGTALLITAAVCFWILRSTRITEFQKEVHSWMGYKFNFPTEDVQLIHGDGSLLNRPYKFLMYIDDMGCTSCNLRLREWADKYETIFNKVAPDALSIVILFDGKKKEDILLLVKSAQWGMPVLWDRNGTVNKQRKFPRQTRMRRMLLDSDNRVIAIGDPLHSIRAYNLYLETILKSNKKLFTNN